MAPTLSAVVRAPAPMWPAGNKFADLNKRETDGLLSRDIPEMNIRSDDDLLAERDDAFAELLDAREDTPEVAAEQKQGYYPPIQGGGYGGGGGQPVIIYNAAGRQGATKAGFAIAFFMMAAALF